MGIAVAHIALWTNRLEELRDFYVRYFDGESGPVYRNPAKGFESFFVRFDGVVALELMRRTDIRDSDEGEHTGFCHVAFGVGSREAVCSLIGSPANRGRPGTDTSRASFATPTATGSRS